MSSKRFSLTAHILGLTGDRALSLPVPSNEWVIDCPRCELVAFGYDDRAEAQYLADVHNDLHHGSREEALAVLVQEPVIEPEPRAGGGL